jgi:hypothetical protein
MKKIKIMLSTIEQITKNKAGLLVQGLKEDARKGNTPKGNQGKRGKIIVTNVLRRAFQERMPKLEKGGVGDTLMSFNED